MADPDNGLRDAGQPVQDGGAHPSTDARTDRSKAVNPGIRCTFNTFIRPASPRENDPRIISGPLPAQTIPRSPAARAWLDQYRHRLCPSREASEKPKKAGLFVGRPELSGPELLAVAWAADQQKLPATSDYRPGRHP